VEGVPYYTIYKESDYSNYRGMSLSSATASFP